MKRSFNVFSSGIRFIPAITASQFCKNDLRSSECSLTCNKSSVPYSAPASSLVLKYCSNMRSTWRPLTTRLDCASVSLNVKICLANSPFATLDNCARILVSKVTKFWGFPNSAIWFFFSSRSSYTLRSQSQASSGRCDAARISSRIAVLHDLYFSGVGNSGNLSVSASLTLDPDDVRDALPPKAVISSRKIASAGLLGRIFARRVTFWGFFVGFFP